jgi:N-acetylmuramoyl-L-alanine amidase
LKSLSAKGKVCRAMRTAICAALLLAGLCAGSFASSAPSRLSRIYFLGSEYVRVDDWARSHGFRSQWTVWKDELKVSSQYTTIIFNVDSRRVTINGVAVWLSTAIALRNNTAYISPADLLSSIDPILFPSKNPPGRQITTICLDPGHGGRDPGNLEGRQQEKKYTLLLAQELKATLAKAGFKVVLTRTGDTYPDLNERPAIANRRGADLFVSLHFNSADSVAARSVHGVEVYCLTPSRAPSTNTRGPTRAAGFQPGNRLDSKNILLAYQIQRAMVNRLGAEDRGVRRARWEVLRTPEMPAVLIEAGFMTHPVEAKKIYNSTHRQQMAQAITAGILAYKKAVEPSAQ